MQYVRKAKSRGTANFGWLDSKHSFSFGNYYDPQHMGVSALRVINDDTVAPGQGFGKHGHKDMEIISYVIAGALKHEDSSGNSYVVPEGDVQRMSAGSGITHSEMNASDTEQVKFLQIWIQPNVHGISPDYEQKSFEKKNGLTPLVAPDQEAGALFINQNARISRLILNESDTYELATRIKTGYLHIIKGNITVTNEIFNAGDGFAISEDEKVSFKVTSDLEALWFDLP